ncbi:MAG: hypothetical protein PHE58_01390 [Candidatus Omnitrophica bacterium]|nr:hypothetical protein [Candidatus Omnitrophota bacterium]
MIPFERLYGVAPDTIKKHCIISPMNESQVFSSCGILSEHKGVLFRVTQIKNASIIIPKMNMLAGDCVLGLRNTACRNIYLFGSCGAVESDLFGEILLIKKSRNLESFTCMLKDKKRAGVCFPDKKLLKDFSVFAGSGFTAVDCATVNSVLLEEEYLPYFRSNGIRCVDMESSMVFSAAASAGKRSVAVVYVSDSIRVKPFYAPLSGEDIRKVYSAKKLAAELICGYINASKY